MTQFSNGTDTFDPRLVDGYEVTRASRSIVHDIIGTNNPAVAIQPASLRSGTIRTVWNNLEDALEFADALSVADIWTLSDADHPTIDMTFVTGNVAPSLDSATRLRGIVEFDFQEVAT